MESYAVVGNEYFIITDERKVLRKDGKPTNLPETETTITIPLYGYLKEIEKEWLYWLSYFKLSLPKGFEEYVYEYEFKKLYSLSHMRVDPMMVIFKTPVYMDAEKNYRLIARFPKYAISTLGIVLNLHANIYSKPNLLNNHTDYLTSAIVDQANLYSKSRQMTHRLVATTWVSNADYEKYYLVDHVDGNKRNCHYTNLRWTDHTGNNKAAVNQGLRTDNYKVITRNVNTGEVKEHDSLTNASVYMGRSRINSRHTPLRHDFIWKGSLGEFELKRACDDRPWYFIDKEITIPIKSLQTVTGDINGKKFEFPSLHKAAMYLFDIFHPMSSKRFMETFKRNYPTGILEIKTVISIQAKKDNVVYEALGAKPLSRELPEHISDTTILKYCNSGKCYNGWQFRYKPEYDDIPWAECVDEQPSNTSKKVYAKNVVTNEHYVYNSLREASRSLSVDKKTITSVINNKQVLFNIFNLSWSPYAEMHS